MHAGLNREMNPRMDKPKLFNQLKDETYWEWNLQYRIIDWNLQRIGKKVDDRTKV